MTGGAIRETVIKIERKLGLPLFYAALILLLFSTLMLADEVVPDVMRSACSWARRIASLLCLIRISLTVVDNPRYTAITFCLFLMMFISSRVTQNNILAYTFLIVAASKGADFRIVRRIYLAFFLLMLVLNPLLCSAGLAGDVVKHRLMLVGHSFGFPNPNALGFVLCSFGMLICCGPDIAGHASRLNGISCAMALLIYLLTLSATSAIIMLLFPVLVLLIEKVKPAPVWPALLPAGLLLLSVLLSAWAGPVYGDNTFISRFSIPNISFKVFGISWLGHNYGFSMVPNDVVEGLTPLYLDNLFLSLPLRCGVIPAAIFLIFISCLLYRLAASDQPVLLAAALCMVVSGVMEEYPSSYVLNFTLLSCFAFDMAAGKRIWKYVGAGVYAITGVILLFMYCPSLPFRNDAEPGAMTIEGIAVPAGFERVASEEGSYPSFLRTLPLASADAHVEYYEGNGPAQDVDAYSYRVVDMPLLSISEQCADVCMHLRAAYLYENRRFSDIHFEDTQHNVMRYPWYIGRLDDAFGNYLIHVYDFANTESLNNEMEVREHTADMMIGDVWCYDARSREDARYGHAMTVVDMAVHPETGEKLFMLVQGSTPACSVHVLANMLEPEISPWFRLDPDAALYDFGFARYNADELRCFPSSSAE